MLGRYLKIQFLFSFVVFNDYKIYKNNSKTIHTFGNNKCLGISWNENIVYLECGAATRICFIPG